MPNSPSRHSRHFSPFVAAADANLRVGKRGAAACGAGRGRGGRRCSIRAPTTPRAARARGGASRVPSVHSGCASCPSPRGALAARGGGAAPRGRRGAAVGCVRRLLERPRVFSPPHEQPQLGRLLHECRRALRVPLEGPKPAGGRVRGRPAHDADRRHRVQRIPVGLLRRRAAVGAHRSHAGEAPTPSRPHPLHHLSRTLCRRSLAQSTRTCATPSSTRS